MKTQKQNPSSYYDAVAKHYDQLYTDPLSQAENEIIAGKLFKKIEKKSGDVKILDLGCGTGLGYEMVKARCVEAGINLIYHGIDISSEMVKVAQEKHLTDKNCTFQVLDMNHLEQLPDNTYDIVCSIFGSFSHAEQYEEVLSNINRVLLPSGEIFLMTYSRFSLRNISNFITKFRLKDLKFEQQYDVRNNNAGISCKAFFYSTRKMFKLLKKHQFNGLHSFGVNIFFELPFIKKVFGKQSIVKFLLEKELALGWILPNLGHSLIIEGTCSKTCGLTV